MGEVEITADVLNGLAAKVDGLDLTDAERAVLDAVLARAAGSDDGDVEGYVSGSLAERDGMKVKLDSPISVGDVSLSGRKWGVALGIEDRANWRG